MKALLVLLLLIGAIYPLIAQEELYIENIIEQYMNSSGAEEINPEVYEMLIQRYHSPINLNKADKAELEGLFLLSNQQIDSFLNYRKRNGRLLSIFELQAIPLFDLLTINQIKPFIYIPDDGLQADNRNIWQRIKSEQNSYLILRMDRTLENKAGYAHEDLNQQYLGSPNRLYSRLRIQHTNDFSIGLTAEKDAGEQLSWQPSLHRYGADFYSFHFQLKNKGRLKNIILGDYQLQFGQSIVFGAGFTIGKGSATIATARRPSLGIIPYTSTVEMDFFRGIASTYRIAKQLEWTNFYSYNTADASINEIAYTSNFKQFSSLKTSGYHRNLNELEDKRNLTVQNIGGALIYKSKSNHLQLGSSYLYTLYDAYYQKKEQLYNKFEFKGSENAVYSLFGNYYFRNTHLFSELAISQSKGMGAVAGAIVTLSNNFELSILVRRYDKDFHSFYGTSFAENSRAINERGVYVGINKAINRKTSFSIYWDKFSFPWLKFAVDSPSQGMEILGRLNYSFSKKIGCYFQYRLERKEQNFSSPDTFNKGNLIIPTQKQNLVANLAIQSNTIISLKTRIQFSFYKEQHQRSSGLALVQDINADFNKIRLSTRFAIFDTDDFENRQYIYERDVLYAFSIPAYQYAGVRNYLLLRYKLTKKLNLYAKWSQFRYFGKDEISSGTERIQGSKKTDLKIQVLLKF